MPSGERVKSNSINQSKLPPHLRAKQINNFVGGSSGTTTETNVIIYEHVTTENLAQYNIVKLNADNTVSKCLNTNSAYGIVLLSSNANELCKVIVFGIVSVNNLTANSLYYNNNGVLSLTVDMTSGNNIQEIGKSLPNNLFFVNPKTAIGIG